MKKVIGYFLFVLSFMAWAVIAILPSGSDHALDEKMLSNIQEVKARGARVIVIAHEGAEVVGAEHIIRIPS